MNLGKHDPFRNVDSWDESTAAEWAAALELRASADDQKEFRRRIRTLAHLKPGDHVVEIGCGVGALLCYKYFQVWSMVHGGPPTRNAKLSPREFQNKRYLIKSKTIGEDGNNLIEGVGVYSIVGEIIKVLDN